ncbi:hypothetical protein ABZS86_11370 [Streptomyces sp. NPDC005355]|uniref:hypothetical protein n=1 Tax=Streptomyces sp. NPDC005355 TaxID=3157038 RepID=UPI0033A64E37
MAAKTTAKKAAEDEATPCECSIYDAIPADLTEEQVASGDYEVFTTGCTATTKSQFAPGHDAKLKSFLIKHGAAGHEIRRNKDGVATSASVHRHAKRYAFAHMVAAGVQRAEAKAAEKAERQAKKPVAKTAPKAKVGRSGRNGQRTAKPESQK